MSLEAENVKLASKLQFCEASLNNLEEYSRLSSFIDLALQGSQFPNMIYQRDTKF